MPRPLRKKESKQPGVLLLAIGDELLDGRTANSNATWFGEQLRLAGVSVDEVLCVGDAPAAIRAALLRGRRFRFVVATGGLGPTNDDRTLASAAATFRRPLVATPISLRHVRARYEARGLPLTEARLRLALIPRGAAVLANPTGTAPGVRIREGSTEFYFLPGPPTECRPMFSEKILPRLRAALASHRLARREFWRCFGRGESDIYQRVAPVIAELENRFPDSIRFGVHISFPCVDLTLEHWRVPGAASPKRRDLDEAVRRIDLALGALCFTRARETLAEAVARLLREQKATLAVAESCTGGLLGKLLTDLPGSSEYFLGGALTYANSAKEKLLGVRASTLREHGAVSEACAREMARGARARLRASLGVSITGVAGPGGGSATKPVGTVYVAVSGGAEPRIVHQVILGGKGSRDQNRVIAAHLALDAVRAEILGLHASQISVN